MSRKKSSSEAALWRRRSLEVQQSDVVASRARGPEPPKVWASRLRALVQMSQHAEEGPSWWTPVDAYFGNLETRTDPQSYHWDGMKRVSPRDLPLVFFQFTFAGFGQFELYGRPPERITRRHGLFRGHSFAAPLLPAAGVCRLDLRLDRYLPPIPSAAHRETGAIDRADRSCGGG